MQQSIKNLSIVSLQNHDEAQSKYFQRLLNQMYYTLLFGEDASTALDLSTLSQLKKIETAWIESAQRDCLQYYPCDQEVSNGEVVAAALKKHRVYQHKLFDFLLHEAGMEDLKKFILSESVLNLEFFDYLALSIIGVPDQAKSEIAANLWDEAGRGNIQQFHTTLFKKLMEDLGLRYDRQNIIENMTWEGLAGINLFSYFSIYPFNKMKYFGLLAATEMLDPPHYHKLIKAINRIFNQKIDHTYYVEHEIIDIEHADGWLQKVILPELNKNPHKTRDFWLGFYLRLESAEKYYNSLLSSFMTKQAA
ncbi:iron-containing redox enzyme family protein [Aquicella lusitana]|uniref:Heme oxygenase-like protein n=1 Tax=Aquicella lusitana TaxID=254246 RepID=A0A370GND9_9COXI|nr:iron-containing redox enzyme family protein [Aquicella lusitana]RDI44839.1 heme oxygenase-like protein [Aquicella lusitana]VVC73036.1 hypothetical protein AQULUS_07640 [Aquicella lusitana]